MFEFQSTIFAAVPAELVWQLWSDVSTWSQWDRGVVWCKMKAGNRFEVGGEAELLPKGAEMPVTIRITECMINQRFSDEGALPLGTLRFHHWLTPEGNGVHITHRLEFFPHDEKARVIFETAMMPKLQEGLPHSLQELAHQAEAHFRQTCRSY